MSAIELIVTLTTIIAAIAAIHWLVWLGLRLLMQSAQRVPSDFWGLRDWARDHPVHSCLAARYPRLYGVLRARLSPHSFTGLPLTLMTAAALYVLALLGGMIEDLLQREGIIRFDLGINAFFAPYRVHPLLDIFLWVTTLGSGPAVTAVAVTSTGFLWADRRSTFIAPLWISLLGAEATTWTGKYLVGRARPEFIEAASAASPSFPSGHATASMAVYGFLAYALARDLPQTRSRFEVSFWTAVLIALVGFSRIFLSLHYVSDVLSGFLVGSFWLLVGFAIAERARAPNFSQSRPDGSSSGR